MFQNKYAVVIGPGSPLKFQYDIHSGRWLSDMVTVDTYFIKKLNAGKFSVVIKADFPKPIGGEGTRMFCLSEAVLRELMVLEADRTHNPTRHLEKHLNEIRELLEA